MSASLIESSVPSQLLGEAHDSHTRTRSCNITGTDIGHIVSRSEAHGCGLCATGPETYSEFASGILNLTPAIPGVNRRPQVDSRLEPVR